MDLTVKQHVQGFAVLAKRTLERESDLETQLEALNVAFRSLRHSPDDDFHFPSTLACMAHAALLSGIALAASGQVASSFMLSRGSIENALYSFYMHQHPELIDVWTNRHDSIDARSIMRKKFTIRKIFANLREVDRLVCLRAEFIYNAAIDQGAHPNIRALGPHLTIADELIGWKLVTKEPTRLRFALLNMTIAGVTTLEIFSLCEPEVSRPPEIVECITQVLSAIKVFVAQLPQSV